MARLRPCRSESMYRNHPLDTLRGDSQLFADLRDKGIHKAPGDIDAQASECQRQNDHNEAFFIFQAKLAPERYGVLSCKCSNEL